MLKLTLLSALLCGAAVLVAPPEGVHTRTTQQMGDKHWGEAISGRASPRLWADTPMNWCHGPAPD